MERSAGARLGYVPQVETIDWNFPVTVFECVLMARTQGRQWPRASRTDKADVAALRGVFSANALVALFDAPWVAVYVLVITLFHPLLGAGAALAESEDRYRQLVDNSPEGVLVHERGVIVFDVSTPSRPTQVAAFDTAGFANSVTVAGTKLVVSDGFEGIVVDNMALVSCTAKTMLENLAADPAQRGIWARTGRRIERRPRMPLMLMKKLPSAAFLIFALTSAWRKELRSARRAARRAFRTS